MRGETESFMRKYKILRQDGGKAEMTYNEICRLLGYTPESNFIAVTTAGTISFTVGKPHEVLGLARAVTVAGLVQAGNLRQTVRREFGYK